MTIHAEGTRIRFLKTITEGNGEISLRLSAAGSEGSMLGQVKESGRPIKLKPGRPVVLTPELLPDGTPDVLPWSTWAMIAIFRISLRRSLGSS